MAHTSEHLAVLGNIERYYASEKGGGGSSNLLEQLKRYFCVGILLFESTPIVCHIRQHNMMNSAATPAAGASRNRPCLCLG